jgi:6-phosphofructokinase 1
MGAEAVKAAVAGETDKMVAIERAEGQGYKPQVKLVPLTATANTEHKFPVEWITEDGAGIKEEFAAYAMPLIQGEPDYAWENGLPRFAKLKKVLVKE